MLAIVIIVLITLFNSYGVRWGKLIQNVFTVAKLGGMAALLVLGATVAFLHPAVLRANFAAPWHPLNVTPIHGLAATTAFGLFIALCVSQTGSLFSADSWHNITFIAGEVRRPERNLPLSLALGTVLVIGLYLLCNVCYLAVMPLHVIQTAPSDRVATLAVNTVVPGVGAVAMAALIMVSTFGTVNGLTLAGGRACYAMAQDGIFFRSAGRLNAQGVPAIALLMQCAWALLAPEFFVTFRFYFGE